MATRSSTTSPRPASVIAWPLTLEAELPERDVAHIEGLLPILARHMADAGGVRAVTVEALAPGRLLRVEVTLEAWDLVEAVSRAIALLRSCARRAGFGRPIVLGVLSTGTPGP